MDSMVVMVKVLVESGGCVCNPAWLYHNVHFDLRCCTGMEGADFEFLKLFVLVMLVDWFRCL